MPMDLISELTGGAVGGALTGLGKPVMETIGRLIGLAVDEPKARTEAAAQVVKDEADARSTVTRALAQKAAEVVISDPALVERSMARWVTAEVRKQANREAVAIETARTFQGDAAGAAEKPSEDFMSRFERLADDASTEEMRGLLGRVLAGEIRRPRRFRLATLHALSVVDGATAKLIDRFKPWFSTGALPNGAPFNGAPYFAQLSQLSDIGLVRLGLGQTVKTFDSEGMMSMRFGTIALVFGGAPPGETVRAPVYQATPVGLEILGLLDSPVEVDDLRVVADAWQKILGTKTIEWGRVEVVSSDDEAEHFRVHNPTPI